MAQATCPKPRHYKKLDLHPKPSALGIRAVGACERMWSHLSLLDVPHHSSSGRSVAKRNRPGCTGRKEAQHCADQTDVVFNQYLFHPLPSELQKCMFYSGSRCIKQRALSGSGAEKHRLPCGCRAILFPYAHESAFFVISGVRPAPQKAASALSCPPCVRQRGTPPTAPGRVDQRRCSDHRDNLTYRRYVTETLERSALT